VDIEVIKMPTQQDIINTAAIAKTSYHSGNYNDALKKLDFVQSCKFLESLIKVGHESSIEPLIFTFNIIGISRVATRQLRTHRIASHMEKSFRRKRKFNKTTFAYPPDSNNKELYEDFFLQSVENYYKLIAAGETSDDARRVLAEGATTEYTLTINARSLRNFIRLRLDKTANWEIRRLAAKIASILIAEQMAFLIRDILQYFNEKDKK
jgi:thymidylate synthase (FAD)